MLRLAHIINPVRMPATSDLAVAQPVTFRSFELACDFAKDFVEVNALAAAFPEDQDYVPSGFRRTRPLDRSVLDCGSFQHRRRLPLMADILERLAESSDADFLIYTNVDIALMPHFYVWVAETLASGIDAMMITRRTISKTYRRPEEIFQMFAEVGEKHPGNDCFVFTREAWKHYDLGRVCVGARFLVPALGANLVCHARGYRYVADQHLTFHIGDDQTWKEDRFSDYAQFNRGESGRVLRRLHGAGLVSLDAPFMRRWLRRCAPELLPRNERPQAG